MVNIYIQDQLVDQYKDENIEVISQVVDLGDITKVKGDYSKTFTVPASKANNKLFKHWYNASISGGFDARTKVKGRIDIDGIPFKTGKFLLRSTKVDNGIATSYTINFFGNVTSFKDIIGEDKLNELDFTGLDFTFSDTVVKDKLIPNVATPYPEVVYTITGKNNYYYNSEFSVKDDDGNIVSGNPAKILQVTNNNYNIAFKDTARSNDSRGLRWNEIIPSLRVDQIISAVETKYNKLNGYSNNIVFSRDFFGTTEFNRLYLMLTGVPEEGEGETQIESSIVNWVTSGGQGYISTANETFTDSSWSEGDSWAFRFEARQLSDLNSTIKLRVIDGDGVVRFANTGFADNNTDTQTLTDYEFSFNIAYSPEFDDLTGWKFFIINEEGGDLAFKLFHRKNGGGEYLATGIDGASVGSGTYKVNDHLPELKVMEFMKAMFQMFKLVIVPQDDGTLYVNTLNSFYEQGSEYEISKYVDRSSLKISRANIISSLEFEFAEGDTWIAKRFREENGRGYGDSKVTLTDEFGDLLEGDSISVKLPFEQVMYNRLTDRSEDGTGGITNIQTLSLASYKGVNDDLYEFEGVDSGAILHYIIQQSHVDKPIHWKSNAVSQNGFSKLEDITYMASHHIDINIPFSALIFEKEISTYTGEQINNTLYFNHYQNYVNDVYGIKSRLYNYTAKLPTIMSANLKMNDVLVIDGVRHRINKYKYNMLTGISNLDVVNSNQTILTQSGNRIPNVLSLTHLGDTLSFALENSDLYTITKTSLGQGTTWATISTSFQASRGVQRHNRVNIAVTENGSANSNPRQMKIIFTAPDGTVTSLIITQYGE